ncbi:MAG: hypothetical protein JW941_12320 [Candidatus Coatesbacteria bacterium]|nr:hypothetical protein [Candidatus Coatesbacteria bacterium]
MRRLFCRTLMYNVLEQLISSGIQYGGIVMNQMLLGVINSDVLGNARTLIIGLVLCCFVLSASLTFAVTYQVRQDGSGDFAAIQEAIDAAANGDEIVVHPGSYYENVRFCGKNITLRSLEPADDAVVASTIIDGGQNGCVVRFDGTENESCELAGFTITNGSSSYGYGGGILGGEPRARPQSDTLAKISSCVITGNAAGWEGGGLAYCDGLIDNCVIAANSVGLGNGGGLYDCDGLINHCLITSNSASSGGGLCDCDGSITYCEISDNAARWGGGGLYYCNGIVSHCMISGNSAEEFGGGIYNCGAVIHCTISDNSAGYHGGGLASCLYSTISHCRISGNSVELDGGGVAHCWGTIRHCEISGNSAEENGGGLHRFNGAIVDCSIISNSAGLQGGGLYDCYGVINRCLITGNSADWQGGGGLCDCDGTISSCEISDNSGAWAGGGLFSCDCTISSCEIAGNSAGYYGGGLYSCYLAATNCMIRDNWAGYDGGGFSYCDGVIRNGTVIGNSAGECGGGSAWWGGTISGAIIWGNHAGEEGSQFFRDEDAILIYSCIQDWTGDGNISDNPLFASGPLDDYYLSCKDAGQDEDSPCIDAGYGTAMGVGLDTLTTRTDGIPDAGIVDMGYHYSPSLGQGARIECFLNTSRFRPGDTLVGFIETQNSGPEIAVDVYVAVVLSDGAVISITGEGLSQGIHSWISGAVLPDGFDFGPYEMLRLTVPSFLGDYIFAAALTTPDQFMLIGEPSLFHFTIFE